MRHGTFWIVLRTRESPLPNGRDLAAGTYLELRADTIDEQCISTLGTGLPWRRVYSLRSQAEGGGFDGSDEERHARLIAAAAHFDLVDLELARDLRPRVLNAIPPERRVVSWSGPGVGRAELSRLHRRMLQHPAALYRLVPHVRCASEALEVLRFLRALRRADTFAYADGHAGFWTRALAPRFGAPLVPAELDGAGSWAQLGLDYGLPALPAIDQLYGIVGSSVLHSLSPRIHNAGFRALKHPAVFVPFVEDEFEPFWRAFCTDGALDDLGLQLNGLTVGAPHKRVASELTSSRASIVERAASSNLLVRRIAGWFGGSTDPLSALPVLRRRGCDVRGRSVAVIGCGGSGRSIAAALARAGSCVTLVNRTPERGRHAALRLGVPFVPLADFAPGGFPIVINATPVGRANREMPFDPGELGPDGAVVDLVCADETTALVTTARAANLVAIDGREVLAAQVRGQFRAMIGLRLPDPALQAAAAERPRLAAATT
jgi:3-dehydroquinate dehydratase / shikimate dehydrogenase